MLTTVQEGAEGRFELRPPMISDLNEKVLPLHRWGTPVLLEFGLRFMLHPSHLCHTSHKCYFRMFVYIKFLGHTEMRWTYTDNPTVNIRGSFSRSPCKQLLWYLGIGRLIYDLLHAFPSCSRFLFLTEFMFCIAFTVVFMVYADYLITLLTLICTLKIGHSHKWVIRKAVHVYAVPTHLQCCHAWINQNKLTCKGTLR